MWNLLFKFFYLAGTFCFRLKYLVTIPYWLFILMFPAISSSSRFTVILQWMLCLPQWSWDYLYCWNAVVLQAIPDTKLTIRKYADAKFEYLVSLPTHKLCNVYMYIFRAWKKCCLAIDLLPGKLLVNLLTTKKGYTRTSIQFPSLEKQNARTACLKQAGIEGF